MSHSRTLALSILALVALACMVACDEVKVAEQSRDVAFATIDAWFRFEHQNPALAERLIPGAHARTEEMRREVPPAVRTVESAISLMRVADNRQEKAEAKAELRRSLAVLNAQGEEARAMLAKASPEGGAR